MTAHFARKISNVRVQAALQDLYEQPIEGLDESIRIKVRATVTCVFLESHAGTLLEFVCDDPAFCFSQMAKLFQSRWYAFHAPIMTAAFAMEPQFCQRELDGQLRSELYKVMLDLSKMPGAPDYHDIKSEYIAFQEAIKLGKVCAFPCVHKLRC
jgi:hypothetical protein